MILTLDCRGLACPEPVLKCRELIQTQQPEIFLVLVDNRPAVENITRFAQNSGYFVQDVETREENVFALTVLMAQEGEFSVKKDVPSFEKAAFFKDTEIFNKKPMFLKDGENYADYLAYHQKVKTVLFLSTDKLGHGDDELGAKLMENFLATLPEMHLWHVIMVNGGVKLATTEGKNLESLKKLAAQGVKISVCGTCLNHFGLLEEKKIGETTNMLDIVTALDLADKVIRP